MDIGSIRIIQLGLWAYRVPFFEHLARHYGDRLKVYASPADLDGSRSVAAGEFRFDMLGEIVPVGPFGFWQRKLVTVPMKRGDVVVISANVRVWSSVVALLKAKAKGAIVVAWGHFWSSTSRSWRARLRLAVLSLCDAVLLYTDREVEEVRKSGWVTSNVRLFALNNGLELSNVHRLRASFVAAERPSSMLFIGRLTDKCGLEALIMALARLDDGVRLEVIGAGPREKELRALALAVGVESRVAWHGALYREEDISRVANRCRLFAYPGAVGLSLVHAMGYGLPSIVGDNRWRNMPEIAAFEDGVTGLAVPMESGDHLAVAIQGLIYDANRLEAMSGAAIRKVVASFNVKDMTARFIEMVAAVSIPQDRPVSERLGRGGR